MYFPGEMETNYSGSRHCTLLKTRDLIRATIPSNNVI